MTHCMRQKPLGDLLNQPRNDWVLELTRTLRPTMTKMVWVSKPSEFFKLLMSNHALTCCCTAKLQPRRQAGGRPVRLCFNQLLVQGDAQG